ncbi:hypothetical protein SUDANB67_04295 [Nocardiopsis dassonvillei]
MVRCGSGGAVRPEVGSPVGRRPGAFPRRVPPASTRSIGTKCERAEGVMASDRAGPASCLPTSGGVRLWRLGGVHTLDRERRDVQRVLARVRAVRAGRSGARRSSRGPEAAGRERTPAENGALRRRPRIRVLSGRKAAAHSAARASAPDECMRKALLGISLERSGRKRLFVRRRMGVVSAMPRRGPVAGREGRSGSSEQVGAASSLGVKDSPLRPPEPVSPTPLSPEVDMPCFLGDCYGSRRPPVVITTTAIVRFFPPRNTAQPP